MTAERQERIARVLADYAGPEHATLRTLIVELATDAEGVEGVSGLGAKWSGLCTRSPRAPRWWRAISVAPDSPTATAPRAGRGGRSGWRSGRLVSRAHDPADWPDTSAGTTTPLVRPAGPLALAAAFPALALPVLGRHAPHVRCDAVVAALALGALGTGLAYLVNHRLITEAGASGTAVVISLLPIVAVVLAPSPG